MALHVPNEFRLTEVKYSQLRSSDSDGNNGAFMIKGPYTRLFIIASDGAGWEHVSVSRRDNRCPSWEEMCFIKNLFWDEEDVVMQLHPKKSEYVNLSEGCLHLWRPIDQEIPTPPKIMVGF